MLFHVVGAGELLGAPQVGTRNSLLGRVDLGVTRGVAGGSEGLLAPVCIPIAARETLSRTLVGGNMAIVVLI